MQRIWSQPQLVREQAPLMEPSPDEKVGQAPGLRFLDAFLRNMDWSAWEAKYSSDPRGRPPHHPRVMAAAVLYGLIDGVTSTRGLEKSSRLRLDYHWLLEGRVLDHSTIGKFRNRFTSEIKDLFRQINRRAAELQHMTLEDLMIDGTQVRANSDRHSAKDERQLERKLSELEDRMDQRIDQLQEAEDGEEVQELRQQVDRLEKEVANLREARNRARNRSKRKRKKDGIQARSARVPVQDVDAYILPNKDGGYAPNYTPVVAVDAKAGLIAAEHIDEESSEEECIPELVKESKAACSKQPERVCMDQNFASGEKLANLEEAGTRCYVPSGNVKSTNPAERENPSEAVAEDKVDELPMRAGRFSREAFVYDADADSYFCPMGKRLEYKKRGTRKGYRGKKADVRYYSAKDCTGCPLASRCRKGEGPRMVSRDEYEGVRERINERLSTKEGKKIYAQRAPVVEGTIAILKSVMGYRRFMRRGLSKVRAEWTWLCAAFNLKKLMALQT